jgi:DNA modification methylase
VPPEKEDRRAPLQKPTLRVMTTTLWEFPSQHYDVTRTNPPSPGASRATRGSTQGSKHYTGATPSWIIWQLLQRYTREGDTVLDPMCGSGTTLDVCSDLDRRGIGFDLAPTRPEIVQADARALPAPDESADFVFVDPPYSTHVDYSDDPRCIGRLDAAGDDDGEAYYEAMGSVFAQIDRVLKNRRYMALYVSDSWRKRAQGPGGVFMPIGFELFGMLRRRFKPVDIISVVRHNQKLGKGNWHKAAEEGNFFLRGFNYLFIFKKERAADSPAQGTGEAAVRDRPERRSQRPAAR